MERVLRQQYTTEFREQAVRLVLEQQVTIPEAPRRLTMSGNTLKNWVGGARHGQLETVGAGRRPEDRLLGQILCRALLDSWTHTMRLIVE